MSNFIISAITVTCTLMIILLTYIVIKIDFIERELDYMSRNDSSCMVFHPQNNEEESEED